MIKLQHAIESLRPNAKWVIINDEVVWKDANQIQPSSEELNEEMTRLQTEYEKAEYQRNRVSEYPSIGDQLDALWKGGEAAAEMLARVQAVKAKYPKPE